MTDFTHQLHIDGEIGRWFICWPDGTHYAGPYGRSQDAKGQLTRLKRFAATGYTPAARQSDPTEGDEA